MMNIKKRILLIVFVILLGVASTILINFIIPTANKISTDLRAYETRIAYRDNYRLHTTPLSTDVVDHICSKLNIKDTSENCKPGAVVYAPDFFDEIKSYFNELPEHDKTYATVDDRLGKYLVFCEEPTLEGHYRCRYDIRGDKVYTVLFFFNEKDFYYQIIANIGGS